MGIVDRMDGAIEGKRIRGVGSIGGQAIEGICHSGGGAWRWRGNRGAVSIEGKGK